MDKYEPHNFRQFSTEQSIASGSHLIWGLIITKKTYRLVEFDPSQQLDAVQQADLVELATDAQVFLQVLPGDADEHAAVHALRLKVLRVLAQTDVVQPRPRHPPVVQLGSLGI